MSESYYGLSETEHELMKYFWASDQPLSFAKIYEHCKEQNYGWAQTTLHTYLTRLIKKGVLHSDRNGYKRSYYPEITEAELAHNYATHIVDDFYGGSIANLMVSLTYHADLAKEDVEELKQILNNNLREK